VWTVRGSVEPGIPLRHAAPGGGHSRLLFSPVLWQIDGREIVGQVEHVDRVVDGHLLGVQEYDAAVVA